MLSKMRAKSVALAFAVVIAAAIAADLKDQCAGEFQKVSTCLTFATGKADAPTKQCCGSVTEIKESQPACLCYFIRTVHNGTSSELKGLGIQEARMMQLPSACRLANASITDCPRLLNIPPNSPDYGIFNGSYSTTTSPTAPTGTSSSPATADAPQSYYKPHLLGPLAVAFATRMIFMSTT